MAADKLTPTRVCSEADAQALCCQANAAKELWKVRKIGGTERYVMQSTDVVNMYDIQRIALIISTMKLNAHFNGGTHGSPHGGHAADASPGKTPGDCPEADFSEQDWKTLESTIRRCLSFMITT